MNTRLQWLDSLELAEPAMLMDRKMRVKRSAADDVDSAFEEFDGESAAAPTEEAVINYKSIQSFEAGLSDAAKDDVLDSLLLAQRAATKAFPAETQLPEWHKQYYEVLSNLGWVFTQNIFEKFETKNTLFEIEKALMDILGAALTGNQLALIMKSIAAFKSLGDNDKRFLAFEKNTHSMQKASFQVGVAFDSPQGLTIRSTAFVLNSTKNVTKVLFFQSSKDDSQLQYSQMEATLNESKYADVRQLVRQKLGDTATYVANLDI